MTSFRRGLRNRNPVVLAVAVALTIPTLLAIQSFFTSGAWSAVPMQRWMRTGSDDYMYVSWQVADLKRHPPRLPLVALLGGSSGREALVSGDSLAAEVASLGGPEIAAANLSSIKQRYAQSWAIADNLPDTPTTVLVGVNLGRFTTTPESNYSQAVGRELLIKSDSLRQFIVQRSGQYKYSYTILPGIFSALTSYARLRTKGLIENGRLQALPYVNHAYDHRHVPSVAEKRTLIAKWYRQYYPTFRRVVAFNAAMLDGLVKRARQRGLDVVLVELPYNRQLVGDAFDRPFDEYKRSTRAIAAKYDVPYLDFNRDIVIPNVDFLDISHLLPAGRAIWQHKLAEELVRLYADGSIRGGR